ncbi:unnamed protein product, partial [Prorocentrum cordatum]
GPAARPAGRPPPRAPPASAGGRPAGAGGPWAAWARRTGGMAAPARAEDVLPSWTLPLGGQVRGMAPDAVESLRGDLAELGREAGISAELTQGGVEGEDAVALRGALGALAGAQDLLGQVLEFYGLRGACVGRTCVQLDLCGLARHHRQCCEEEERIFAVTISDGVLAAMSASERQAFESDLRQLEYETDACVEVLSNPDGELDCAIFRGAGADVDFQAASGLLRELLLFHCCSMTSRGTAAWMPARATTVPAPEARRRGRGPHRPTSTCSAPTPRGGRRAGPAPPRRGRPARLGCTQGGAPRRSATSARGARSDSSDSIRSDFRGPGLCPAC